MTAIPTSASAAKRHVITAAFVDICLADYLTDHTGILVGIPLAGQTRDEMIEEVSDEAYSDDEFPLGDHAFDSLKDAIRAEIKPDARFWPVDHNGDEVTDLDSDTIADEQPCVWFRVTVTSSPMRITLDNQGDDDGFVMVTCREADAVDDRCIDGSTWEDMGTGRAWTSIADRPTLYDELVAEGYDVDASCYSAPSEEDLKYWSYRNDAECNGYKVLTREEWLELMERARAATRQITNGGV